MSVDIEALAEKITDRAKGVQADGWGGGNYHRFIKQQKNRQERRRAKRNPECQHGYGRYRGWES